MTDTTRYPRMLKDTDAPSAVAANVQRDVPFGLRLRSLDGLRGIAVLSVVVFHTLRLKGSSGAWGSVWAMFQESTWAGVDLFFVLSGFLITGILLDSRRSNRYFTNFYARRTLRIFPLYYAVLIVALLIAPAVLGMHRLPPLYPRLLNNQIWLWTYLANFIQAREAHTLPGFGHFWSLAVEEQFYWFWPLAIFACSRRALLRFCVATCCLLPIARAALLWNGANPWALRQYTFTRFDTLLFGAVVAIVVRDPLLANRARRVSPALMIASVVSLVVIGVRFGFIPFEASETLVIGYSAFGILFATIVLQIVNGSSKLSNFLSTRVLRWFGKYSYGIYIFHWPVAQGIQGAIERWLSSYQSELITVCCYFTLVLGISSGAAWITWNCFEAQFLKLKRYFEYSAATAVSPPEVTVLAPASLLRHAGH